MKAKAVILTIILALFYPFALISKFHKNRVTFISLEHDNLSKDFKLIHDQLKAEGDYDVKALLFKFTPGLKGNLKYGLTCIRQLFAINSSRLVIIDYNNFVISRFKHKTKVKILQIWHAPGALKKFGNEVKRDYKIKNYDYAIVNSDFYKGVYSRAFNLPEKHIITTGIPLNDQLFDLKFKEKAREKLYQKYPMLRDKKVVTYAPTFRGRISKKFREVSIDFEMMQEKLGDDYLIIYKSHPLISESKYANLPNILSIDEELISKLFCVTDILITDYSAIAIDWMVFNKPIISFAPDFEKYKEAPGFVIDYLNEFPGPVTHDEETLIQAILQADSRHYEKKRREFTQKTYNYMDGKSLGRVVELIYSIVK